MGKIRKAVMIIYCDMYYWTFTQEESHEDREKRLQKGYIIRAES